MMMRIAINVFALFLALSACAITVIAPILALEGEYPALAIPLAGLLIASVTLYMWVMDYDNKGAPLSEKRKRDESPEKPKRWYVTDDGELVERTPLSVPPRGAYGVVRFSDQDIVAYTEREYESLSEAAWYENRQRVIAAQIEEHKRRYGRR